MDYDFPLTRITNTMLPLPLPRVEVFQYCAYNGSYARERTLLWMYSMVGVNADRRVGESDGWKGHDDCVYAYKLARAWADFTGWPLVERGRMPTYDEAPR